MGTSYCTVNHDVTTNTINTNTKTLLFLLSLHSKYVIIAVIFVVRVCSVKNGLLCHTPAQQKLACKPNPMLQQEQNNTTRDMSYESN